MKTKENTQKVNHKPVDYLKSLMVFSLMILPRLLFAADDVANDIQELYKDVIEPVINVVVVIGITVSAVYGGFLFFQGKRESYKHLIYIIVGVLVIKFAGVIAESILDNK